MSLIKHSATIGIYTMLSRVLGFVRDVIIAATIGASVLSDAFFVAFKIPNFLRRLFAEGAFNSAFIPLYAGMLTADGKEEARKFSSEIYSFLVTILIGLSVVMIAIMPWALVVLAPGFTDDPAKYDLTVVLTRITFPYILFISVVSLLGGILNSFDRFAAVAATPIILNLCLIGIPFAIDPWMPTFAHGLAVAVFFAGVAQMVWLMIFAHRLGMMPKLQYPRLTAGVKKMLILVAPVALGAGVAQINLFIDLIIASTIDSGVSYLYYADRINELPLAIIGIAIGTALLPMLSRQIREGKKEIAQHSQNRAMELALLLALPATAALMVISEPIVKVLYERGEFDITATLQTHRALVAFAAGLPAFVLVKVIAPAFFANKDTKTPFLIGVVCVAVNLFFNLVLIGPLQHVGMAVATTIAGWLNVILMLVILKRREMFAADKILLSRLPRVLLASLLMAAVLLILQQELWEYFREGETLRAMALALLVSVGIAVYALAALLLRAVDVGDMKRMLGRK